MTEQELKNREVMTRFNEGALFIVLHEGNDMDGHSTRETLNYRGKDAYAIWEQIKQETYEGEVTDLEIRGDGKNLDIQGSDCNGDWGFQYQIDLADFITESQADGLLVLEQLKELLKEEVEQVVGPIVDHNEMTEMSVTLRHPSKEIGRRGMELQLIWDGAKKELTYNIEVQAKGAMPSTSRMLGEKIKSLRDYISAHCR